jgi:anti-sigma B factor antagonist
VTAGDDIGDDITVDAEHEPGADAATVRVSGEIDASTAPTLAATLDRVIAAGATAIAVDLGAVDFIDSTGLTTLIAARTQLDGRGTLTVVSPSDAVRRLLDLTGLDELFVLP